MKKEATLIASLICIFLSLAQCSDIKTPLKSIRWWEINRYFVTVAYKALHPRAIEDELEEHFKWNEKKLDRDSSFKQQVDVENTFEEMTQALRKLRDAIVENYDKFEMSKPQSQCCTPKKEGMQDIGCFIGRKGVTRSKMANPPHEVVSMMTDLKSVYKSLNTQYFSLYDGSIYFLPTPRKAKLDSEHCKKFDPVPRPWYNLALSPVPRDILLFVDLQKSANGRAEELMMNIITNIFQTLTQEDRIMVVKESMPTDRRENGRHVELGVWLVCTTRNKDKLIELLKTLVFPQNNSSDQFSLEKASPQKIVTETKQAFNSPMKLSINVTREAEKVVVRVINGEEMACLNSSLWAEENMSEPTVITYFIGSSDISSSSSGPNASLCSSSSKEDVVFIMKKDDLENDDKTFVNFFRWSRYIEEKNGSQLSDEIRITLPYNSYFSRILIISMVLPIIVDNKFVGVVADDITNIASLENINKLEGLQDAYGFLIDAQGRALLHPLLPEVYCPEKNNYQHKCQTPTQELVSRLEQNENVQHILQQMVNMDKGMEIIEGDYIRSTGHALSDEQGNPVRVIKKKLAYIWLPLKSIKLNFAIVIPVYDNEGLFMILDCKQKERCKNPHFNYHLPTTTHKIETCFFAGAEVSRNKGLIKFSPRVFEHPLDYIWNQKTNNDPVLKARREGKGDAYFYMKRTTVKPSVVLANTVDKIWKDGGNLNCFVGSRFFGTQDGVFLAYPGIVSLNNSYDHYQRPWYQVAVANMKSSLTVSMIGPYRDFFSGNEVISIATPITKKLDSGWQAFVGVIGGDLNVGMVTHELRKRLPECDGNTITCFLIDSLGYIVLHLSESKMARNHITEAYTNLADYLIESELLIRDGCHDYAKDAVFLYWKFIMPPGMTAFWGIEKANVAIYEIPFMNVFLVAKKTSPGSVLRKGGLECQSSCSKCRNPPDAPCKVTSFTTKCRESADDMRNKFEKLPACFPSYGAPNNEGVKRNCAPTGEKCFPSTNKECKMWKTKCFEES